jgi:triosephosphate isomerase
MSCAQLRTLWKKDARLKHDYRAGRNLERPLEERGAVVTRTLIAGTGWKMNKTASEAGQYIRALAPLLKDVDFDTVEIFVLPPFTSLATVAALLERTRISYGAQNMHWEEAGPWTGEIAAPMLVEAGCRYAEIGHSERRYHFGETDEHVNRKVRMALKYHLIPIICIGETQNEKDLGYTEIILRNQVDIALHGVAHDDVPKVVLAYEPRWAIGQLESASPQYIQNIHQSIRGHLGAEYGNVVAEQMRIIYGGSVNLGNAGAIIEQVDVDGLFVGRAALEPSNFAHLIKLVEVEALRRMMQQTQEG